MRNLILGTAGHIDHGKTSLVRALTGVNTDRLPEEQRRGMTIELGFADFTEGDIHFGLVDVPGHEKFVRTMVVGATGIDLALLVVAADDSVMPQTVEHVEILDLLGMKFGAVALTKVDMVDPSLVELAADEVRQLLSTTALRDFPIVPVSSITGEGLPELRAALAQQVRNIPDRDSGGPFRMGIDRVFTVAGRGTVVTGSVYSGQVQTGDNLELWPGPMRCKVRGLQTHGDDREQLQVGQRAAINLSGLEKSQVERGCELAAEGAMTQTQVVDIRLTLLSSNRRPLPAYRRVRLCLGTRECLVTVVPSDGSREIKPGAAVYAQLRADDPLVATHGQRLILRDETARRTLGGGVVLRVVGRRRSLDPARDRSGLEKLWTGDDADRVAEILRTATGSPVTDAELSIRSGVALSRLNEARAELERRNFWLTTPGTGRRIIRDLWEQWEHRGCQYLERFHRLHPGDVGCPVDVLVGWLDRRSERGLGRPLLDRLVKSGRVKVLGEFACLSRFAPVMSAQDEKTLTSMLTTFESAGFQPPSIEELVTQTRSSVERVQKLVRIAVATRQLVEVAKGMYLHGRVEAHMRERVSNLVGKTGGATVSEIKDALGTSRKFAVPFVEYLDRIGFTVREGDLRKLKAEPM